MNISRALIDLAILDAALPDILPGETKDTIERIRYDLRRSSAELRYQLATIAATLHARENTKP